MMHEVILTIGLNDQVSKVQEISTENAMEIITNVIADHTDGATIYPAKGIYRHFDGTLITENSIRIECIEPDEKRLYAAAMILKEKLNQETIVWENRMIDSALI